MAAIPMLEGTVVGIEPVPGGSKITLANVQAKYMKGLAPEHAIGSTTAVVQVQKEVEELANSFAIGQRVSTIANWTGEGWVANEIKRHDESGVFRNYLA